MTPVHLTFLQQCVLMILATTTLGSSIKPTRQDLENYLFKEMDYDKNFPPNKDNVTDVSVQLYITDFNSESEKEREIEFTLSLRMNWTDHRLDFTRNETKFDVLTFGDDIVDSIWIPDLYFLQERKSILHGLFKNNQLVYIFKNGSVFYSGRFNIKSHCVMTFEKYPFDTQKCPIEIQSYALTTNLMRLHWNGDRAVEIEPSLDPLKAETSPQEKSIETRYVYPEVGEFSTLKTEIIVPRPSGSYGTVVIAPPVILVLIALMSFFEDYNSRIGNVTQTLTPLLLHWTALYSKISIDSTMYYLNFWMLGNLMTISIVLVTNIFIYMCMRYKKLEVRYML
ncbi:glycine receptor subunit alpha-3-like [Ruditapes philippinarum]|uniref:glycine receptor subunit alpha-3-like n=1 Tax=Ruditapes philippinarum TaxID=129788 RepID=UPI00295BB325|nr:glycine receptor subunit alpha-3-like [Ruditapes philippinarum]XP_060569224.1 glycine receptor subunit alpha-3-like [Ruditapes philippinarum]